MQLLSKILGNFFTRIISQPLTPRQDFLKGYFYAALKTFAKRKERFL